MNPLLETVDLDAYFYRIGYEGDRAPTLSTLQALHQHHPQSIPFENLSPLLQEPVRLDLESLQQKLIHQGRGGYCFEQNQLFRTVLIAMGFEVTSLAARVMWRTPLEVINPRSHMVLLVQVAGDRYLADVGFGGLTLTAPIQFIPGLEQATSHEPFRLVQQDDLYVLQAYVASAWQSLYRFDLQEQHPPDYEVSNWYVSTHPESLFVNNLIAARPDAGCRYALHNNHFNTHYLNGLSEQQALTSAAELAAVLEDKFRLTLPDSPQLEMVLQRFTAS